MARHRHVISVRDDGLSIVLEPFVRQRQVIAATLVDVASGMVLDGFAVEDDAAYVETLAATHAELMRLVSGFASGPRTGHTQEMTVVLDDDIQHLLRAVPDPHGGQLVLSVVVRGTTWQVGKAWKQLRSVSSEALTAGPSNSRRPVNGQWELDDARPDRPVVTDVVEAPVIESWFTRDGAAANPVRRSELPRRLRPAQVSVSAATPAGDDRPSPTNGHATNEPLRRNGAVLADPVRVDQVDDDHYAGAQVQQGGPEVAEDVDHDVTPRHRDLPRRNDVVSANGDGMSNGASGHDGDPEPDGAATAEPVSGTRLDRRPRPPVEPAARPGPARLRSTPTPPTSMPPRRWSP